MSKKLAISDAKALSEKCNLDHVIIFGWSKTDNLQWITTYGKTQEDCDHAAQGGNAIKKFLLNWPEADCIAEPNRVKKLKARIKELEAELAKHKPPGMVIPKTITFPIIKNRSNVRADDIMEAAKTDPLCQPGGLQKAVNDIVQKYPEAFDCPDGKNETRHGFLVSETVTLREDIIGYVHPDYPDHIYPENYWQNQRHTSLKGSSGQVCADRHGTYVLVDFGKYKAWIFPALLKRI